MYASTRRSLAALSAALCLSVVASAQPDKGKEKPDYPPFDEVSKGFEKVISTADGSKSLFDVYVERKKNQLLAELPRGWGSQRYYIAVTQASGGVFAGLQGPSRYIYFRQYDKRIAMIEPEIDTRSTGESHSKLSVERLFTDRVLADFPIVTMGPNGQPVIDLDEVLMDQSALFSSSRFRGGGSQAGGPNKRLARVVKTKAFPENVEIAIEAPGGNGTLSTYHYSISLIPDSTGYKPRAADERVGYFMTVYRDLGQYEEDKKWTRFIDRWHLEKHDPKLRLSPPKEPLVFYIEHTVPVRYRRWVRQGILYWNDAFREIGLDNAIEVRYQDQETGAHMEKDPEDVRFNFIRWLNNDISTAIGPHRAHPLTGQILDADVVLTDGWIRAYWDWYHLQAPELAVESYSSETLQWLEQFPQWDPRLLLSSPQQRERILAMRAERNRKIAAGEEVPHLSNNPALMFNEELAEIGRWLEAEHFQCLAAHELAYHMSCARMNLETLGMIAPEEEDNGEKPKEEGEKKDDVQSLDGIPEWFIGPLLSELTAHEVGHTLGLRHNFKASSIYSLADINSDKIKGKKPFAGSVMDYLPPNFNLGAGEIQGDFTMIGIGPYDKWAIAYGYTFDDPKKILERVAEPELAYLTDDDTGGPDPLARRYDFSSNPLDYAENLIRIAHQHREKLLDKFVKDGESWSKARRGYHITLNMQINALSIMGNWIGGAHVNRDRKGDPNGRTPVQVVDADAQRKAMQFVIDHAFNDDAFGLTPDILAHMTVDKWSDQSPGDRSDPTWPVHDRIMGIQASILTSALNPTTLSRVYDNEIRAGDSDALTLPELLNTFTDAAFNDLDVSRLDGSTFTERNPMISSLRRNLQSHMADRLIALAAGDSWMPRPIRTLAASHLRRLNSKLDALVEKKDSGQLDAYTVAHVEDLNDRIDRALDAVYIQDL